jgi:WD40 repeat protein
LRSRPGGGSPVATSHHRMVFRAGYPRHAGVGIFGLNFDGCDGEELLHVDHGRPVVVAPLHGGGDHVVLARVADIAEVDEEEVDDGVGGVLTDCFHPNRGNSGGGDGIRYSREDDLGCGEGSGYDGQDCYSCSEDGVAILVFSKGIAVPVFDEMPLKDVIWDGDDIIDEMSSMDVVWDEESFSDDEESFPDPYSHDGLLMQLAQGEEFMGVQENVMDGLSPRDKNLTLVSEGSAMCSAHQVLAEMSSLHAVWDTDRSQECSLRHGLLVQLAQCGEFVLDEERKQMHLGDGVIKFVFLADAYVMGIEYKMLYILFKQWDPGIHKFTLLNADVFRRLRAYLVSLGLIMMEVKLFSQNGQISILGAVFENTRSSLYILMSVQIVQRSKGLVVAVLQVISTEESEEEREICSLCWASKGGSVVVVGYITGGIILWDVTTRSSRQDKQSDVSSNVVKLQLASENHRLPVIFLHWSTGFARDIDKGGHLFVYGGDDMGSEEVLTVLSLESAAGLGSVRCMSRTALKLDGSFADMILIPDTSVPDKSRTAALFILTNPGQLTGGVPSEMSVDEDHDVERRYIACYQDGSVRIWDAAFPVLMSMFVLDGKGLHVVWSASISSVSTLGGSSFHFVSESKQEVHVVHHGRGFHCRTAFMATNFPV